ncbi:MAG: serine/threonine-protein kinase [Kofleriaceae bacterium]
MIGQVVGSYRILSQLGAGGMGAVWLAEHTLLGRRVAIKFLHSHVSQNPAMVDRFFAEARAATRIADPGIIVVYDFGWHTDGAAYIVMEYLGGVSVQTRLRDGRFAVVDAVRVVQLAAMAMAVAHSSGIIHRDLKPDNLFLVPDPAVMGGERIKILDFGIAKLLRDEDGNPSRTTTGMIMGTPTYMSPEQCRGAGDIDHRTDIYALGCVLFHLLCGRVPFVASTPGDMIAAHLREAPPVPSMFVPQIPSSIDSIVMRCMAKAADDRYASMTELARDLATAIGVLSSIVSIVPMRPHGTAIPAPALPAPAITVPPEVETVIGSGAAAVAPVGPPSTFTSSVGEMPPSRRSGRMVLGLLAFAGLGIIATIVIATSMTSTSTPGPAGDRRGEVPPDSPRAAVVNVGGAVDAGVRDAAPVDAAVVTKVPRDAGKVRPRPVDANIYEIP